MWVACSVDLEPNKDGTLHGVREAMEWFDDVVPQGTVFATYRIAKELPGVLSMLNEDHEIGVHVHPREFGYDEDELAELPYSRQRDLIEQTRESITGAIAGDVDSITSFRAGRHSASFDTFEVLSELGFTVGASINVRYTDYLSESLTEQPEPFRLENGLIEVPTTFYRPQPPSREWLRVFPGGILTATANTLRTDFLLCSGERAMQCLFENRSGVSMYLHPYDATTYHGGLQNTGVEFRHRLERTVSGVDRFIPITRVPETVSFEKSRQ